MEENIYLHTVNGFRYFLFYHFCFNVKQDVFFLLIVTFFLWLLKSYFPWALLWVKSASCEGNLVLIPPEWGTPHTPLLSLTTFMVVPSWPPLEPLSPSYLFPKRDHFSTHRTLPGLQVIGLYGAPCLFLPPYQTDGETLEDFYLLAAFSSSPTGSQSPFAISYSQGIRSLNPATQMVYLPTAFPSSAPFSFYHPPLPRISRLLILYPHCSVFFIFQFSVHSLLTFRPLGSFLCPVSISFCLHSRPALQSSWTFLSVQSTEQHHSSPLQNAKQVPWGGRSATLSTCVTVKHSWCLSFK